MYYYHESWISIISLPEFRENLDCLRQLWTFYTDTLSADSSLNFEKFLDATIVVFQIKISGFRSLLRLFPFSKQRVSFSRAPYWNCRLETKERCFGWRHRQVIRIQWEELQFECSKIIFILRVKIIVQETGSWRVFLNLFTIRLAYLHSIIKLQIVISPQMSR